MNFILNSNNANSLTVAARHTPFFTYLSDDGTDNTLNEDYSGVNTLDAYFQIPPERSAVLCTIGIVAGVSSVAQSTAICTGFISIASDLTNGLKFAIKNSSGDIVQDITVSSPIKNTGQLLGFFTNPYMSVSLANSGTPANNEVLIGGICVLKDKFGGNLSVPAGGRIVCTLEDDLSGLSALGITVSGYYGL